MKPLNEQTLRELAEIQAELETETETSTFKLNAETLREMREAAE
jgi:hypothetical protein